MCYLTGFLKILKEKKKLKWVLSSILNWSTIHGRGILYSIPLGGNLYLGAFKIIVLGGGEGEESAMLPLVPGCRWPMKVVCWVIQEGDAYVCFCF